MLKSVKYLAIRGEDRILSAWGNLILKIGSSDQDLKVSKLCLIKS